MEQTLIWKEECKRRFQPAADRIQRLLETNSSPVIVAIDGMSASGKSTLGYYLKQLFGGNLFHMDDFFLQGWQRTPERLAEIGGNVDYERFKEEVLEPILKKETVLYRPFRCNVGEIQPVEEVPFQSLNLIEGSYSQHPFFGNPYQLRIYMELSGKLQAERIRKRNGEEMLKRFMSEWVPMENAYFKQYKIKENSMVLFGNP